MDQRAPSVNLAHWFLQFVPRLPGLCLLPQGLLQLVLPARRVEGTEELVEIRRALLALKGQGICQPGHVATTPSSGHPDDRSSTNLSHGATLLDPRLRGRAGSVHQHRARVAIVAEVDADGARDL